MLNVLSIVSYPFLPAKMGGQKGIAFFYQYLSQQVNVVCVTTKANDTENVNYKVLNILSNKPIRYINVFYFFKLKKIIAKNNITHLILEHPYYGWLGLLLKKFCKVKLIIHSHNIEAARFKSTNKWWWKILWSYEKFTHQHADINFFIHDDDKAFAIKNFKLSNDKCFTITYGFELKKPPSLEDKAIAKTTICKKHNIAIATKILLFNGTLDYKPNLDALKLILDTINPLLIKATAFDYVIVVCGNRLPKEMNELKGVENIKYAGFVDDITTYFKGADIFINPVIDGGGIKTKVVEALGYNMKVISTQSGAIGIPTEITGSQLKIINDKDWTSFANEIMRSTEIENIPESFFNYFYWANIANKAFKVLSK
jgi:polysaccharide biosynthesis protein PslH